jgi:hypothetical protein
VKLIASSKSEQNEAILDPWSVVHLGAGLASGLMGAPLLASILVAVVYELVERRAETESPAVRALFKTSGPEVAANAIADVVIFALGAELGRRWNRS